MIPVGGGKDGEKDEEFIVLQHRQCLLDLERRGRSPREQQLTRDVDRGKSLMFGPRGDHAAGFLDFGCLVLSSFACGHHVSMLLCKLSTSG